MATDPCKLIDIPTDGKLFDFSKVVSADKQRVEYYRNPAVVTYDDLIPKTITEQFLCGEDFVVCNIFNSVTCNYFETEQYAMLCHRCLRSCFYKLRVDDLWTDVYVSHVHTFGHLHCTNCGFDVVSYADCSLSSCEDLIIHTKTMCIC